jgi:hypothetical protein
MVQVLPAVPGFGERLADTITQAGSNLLQGYMKGQQNTRDAKVLDKLGDPNLSPVQRFQLVGQLSQDKQKTLIPAFHTLLTSQNQAKEGELNRKNALDIANIKSQAAAVNRPKEQTPEERKAEVGAILEASGFTPEEVEKYSPSLTPKSATTLAEKKLNAANKAPRLTPEEEKKEAQAGVESTLRQAGYSAEDAKQQAESGLPQAAANTIHKQYLENQEYVAKQLEKGTIPPGEKEVLQRTWNRIAEIKNEGYLGMRTSVDDWLNPEYIQHRKEADTLVSQFIGALKLLESSGQLSNTRFNDIVSRSFRTIEGIGSEHRNSTNAEIAGALMAWATQFDLDPSVLLGKSKEGRQNEPTPENQDVFGGGKIKVIHPKTGEEFYPANKEDLQAARRAKWKVIGE